MNEKNLNNISRTNWQALDSMSDEDIDYSDIPPLTDEFFEKATLQIPAAQAKNIIQLEPDIIAWFKTQNKDYQTAINQLLRRHNSATQQKNNQDLRKISLKSSFLRDLCAWSGSLFHESCVSPNNIMLGFLNPTYAML